MIQLTLTLKKTTAQVVKTSVTVNNNSPTEDYVHRDDQTQPTFEMTPGFKPFTVINRTISNILERRKLAEVLSWMCLADSLQKERLSLKPGHSVDVSPQAAQTHVTREGV